MRNNKFIKIASCLGIAIPASLYAATDINVSESELISNEQANIKNEISNRIISMYCNTLLEDATKPVHANYHTDAGGNHSDSHSNSPHNNIHTDKAGVYAPGRESCPVHTNAHTDREGYDNHTNTGRQQHTDKHTNRDC